MVRDLRLYEGEWIGKLPQDELEEAVLSKVRRLFRASTLAGPAVGEDAAIVDLGSCVLVAHADPITEASFNIGPLAIDVAANDVAVKGARPSWAIVVVLMPPGSLLSSLAALVEGIAAEAERLGIEIVGGHTESAPSVSRPVVVVTVLGCACRRCFRRTSDARPGDLLYQVGYVAKEATGIIATDFRREAEEAGISESELEEASRMMRDVSIVSYALRLAEEGVVSSMHDLTEGGLIGGLYELARASRSEAFVDADRVLVHPVTRRVFEAMGLDPLAAMSSGSFVATVPPELRDRAEAVLRSLNVEFSLIGYLSEASGKPLVKVRRRGRLEVYDSQPEDAVAILWSRRRAPAP
mgnify:CR=1 FL=1